MTQGGNIYRDAERRLLDAIRAGEVCDFADGGEITAEVMASWGPERTIRATLLRRLLTAENARYAKRGIQLRGAAVDGELDLEGLHVVPVQLWGCRLDAVNASGAIFTGHARFTGTTFTRDAWFGATVSSDPWFLGTIFTRDAEFDGATFTCGAEFNHAIFPGAARFVNATFTGGARFVNATFTGDALFGGATFAGAAQFHGAIAQGIHFDKAEFQTTDPGPWIAGHVTLEGAVFHMRARVGIAAVKVDCRRLQAREGVHLLVRGGAVNLEDAEFLRWSILAHSGSEPALPKPNDPGERPEGFNDFTPAEQAPWRAKETAFQLAQELADELSPQQVPQTRVVSLRRATAGDLVLSGVGLEDCAFAGAHGLDKLRIDATCSFQRPPAWPWGTWRPFTGRRIIFEELLWRQAHTRGWSPTFTTGTARAKVDRAVPTALVVAGIYRDLRKGLEDAKDEPGAADFYYGEMEMRRLAARGCRDQRMDGGEAEGRRPSWTERRLLDAYWAVSGYGLRAWRALAALTILLVGCAALFTRPAFVKLHPGDTVHFATSLEFTARESLTLTRAAGDPLLQTTGAGTVLDIALRLLAPLLFGLALLAVRGRTKR
jgi:uncharacterized protein YjbI with pentapeptide repeats